MESKYQKGQIYKIVDSGFNKCYIGSTCERLSQRMVRHRINYRRYLKGSQKNSRVVDIFDEYGVENCKILWVEDYPCNSKKELEAREGYYQQRIECVNKRIEGRTHQEKKDIDLERTKQWYKENTEHRKQYMKEYNEQNSEKLKDKKQEWRENNKDKKREMDKEWRERSKDKLSEYFKQYNQTHKEEKKAYNQQKYTCECGAVLCLSSKSDHKKSKKHQEWLKQQEQE